MQPLKKFRFFTFPAGCHKENTRHSYHAATGVPRCTGSTDREGRNGGGADGGGSPSRGGGVRLAHKPRGRIYKRLNLQTLSFLRFSFSLFLLPHLQFSFSFFFFLAFCFVLFRLFLHPFPFSSLSSSFFLSFPCLPLISHFPFSLHSLFFPSLFLSFYFHFFIPFFSLISFVLFPSPSLFLFVSLSYFDSFIHVMFTLLHCFIYLYPTSILGF